MSTDTENPVVDGLESSAEAPEKRYRAVNPFAVASLVLGILSVLTVLGWPLAVIPAAGAALWWLARRRYQRNPEEQTGIALARWGLGLSLGFWVTGWAYLTYNYYTAAPPGYELVDYRKLQPDPKNSEERIPPYAEDLGRDKKNVFVRGYMFRVKQQSGLKQFVLVDDPGACNFCAPKPKPTQLILVKLKGALRAEYTTHQIGVGGVFSVHADPKEEGMSGLVYQIDADILK